MSRDLVIDDVISVPGMTCQQCAIRVKEALSRVPGLKAAQVELEAKRVNVSFDPSQVELGRLIEAIERAGYDAFPG